MDIFEINEDSPVIIEEFMGSKIYYIDNFFKSPNNIVNFMDEVPTDLYNKAKFPIYLKNRNGLDFLELRHSMCINGISKINNYLSDICNQKPSNDINMMKTNISKFFKGSFNDYKNNYWWPHRDNGYTALIYLNKNDKTCGTNLYKNEFNDEIIDFQWEHSHPWRPKMYYSLLKTIEPVYNRCVLFDGLHFLHGMNIENERYFENEFRKNMVFFFENELKLK